MISFKPVRDARLGPGDLAKLCGVARVTCSTWMNGHAQPHSLLTARVTQVVDDIQAALDADLLPVPFHILRRERALYLKGVIEQVRANSGRA